MLPIIGAVAVGALAGALIKSVADELSKDEYEAKIADLELQVADLKSKLDDGDVEDVANTGIIGMHHALPYIAKNADENA